MFVIAGTLYFLFTLFIVVASIVIIWHLMRYSMSKKLATTTVLVFSVVTIILLAISLLLFLDVMSSTKKTFNQVDYYNQDNNPYGL